jgi:hypothetical protein
MKAMRRKGTVNRAAGLLIPLVMGGIAQWFGLAAAFWSTGAMLISALLLVGLLHRRQVPHAGPEKFWDRPQFTRNRKKQTWIASISRY